MITIHKYPLDLWDLQKVEMPEGAEILTAQEKDGRITLWAKVNTLNAMEERFIEIIGTGYAIPIDVEIERKYISTVQKGVFVWHVFERIN